MINKYIQSRRGLSRSLVQGPSWKVASRSTDQDIFILLLNHRLYYCVHKSRPLDPVLSQMNPIHNLPPHFSNISLNIIVPSTPRFSKWSFPFKFSDRTSLFYSDSCYMSSPSYSLNTLTLLADECSLWITSLCSFVLILLLQLCRVRISLSAFCFSLELRDQVLNPMWRV
jgi:hypothetical protein